MEIAQTTFYTLGSIFMLLGIAVLIGLLIVIIKAMQAIKTAQKNISELKENVGEKVIGVVSSRPAEVASILGMGLSSFIMKKMKDMFKK